MDGSLVKVALAWNYMQDVSVKWVIAACWNRCQPPASDADKCRSRVERCSGKHLCALTCLAQTLMTRGDNTSDSGTAETSSPTSSSPQTSMAATERGVQRSAADERERDGRRMTSVKR